MKKTTVLVTMIMVLTTLITLTYADERGFEKDETTTILAQSIVEDHNNLRVENSKGDTIVEIEKVVEVKQNSKHYNMGNVQIKGAHLTTYSWYELIMIEAKAIGAEEHCNGYYPQSLQAIVILNNGESYQVSPIIYDVNYQEGKDMQAKYPNIATFNTEVPVGQEFTTTFMANDFVHGFEKEDIKEILLFDAYSGEETGLVIDFSQITEKHLQ